MSSSSLSSHASILWIFFKTHFQDKVQIYMHEKRKEKRKPRCALAVRLPEHSLFHPHTLAIPGVLQICLDIWTCGFSVLVAFLSHPASKSKLTRLPKIFIPHMSILYPNFILPVTEAGKAE